MNLFQHPARGLDGPAHSLPNGRSAAIENLTKTGGVKLHHGFSEKTCARAELIGAVAERHAPQIRLVSGPCWDPGSAGGG